LPSTANQATAWLVVLGIRRLVRGCLGGGVMVSAMTVRRVQPAVRRPVERLRHLFSDAGIVESVGPPIPPGSSNGTGPCTVNSASFGEAYAVTTIPSGMAAGSAFDITLWASDGSTKQTESVPVVIKASCARRY
jgi:hypothetical protein